MHFNDTHEHLSDHVALIRGGLDLNDDCGHNYGDQATLTLTPPSLSPRRAKSVDEHHRVERLLHVSQEDTSQVTELLVATTLPLRMTYIHPTSYENHTKIFDVMVRCVRCANSIRVLQASMMVSLWRRLSSDVHGFLPLVERINIDLPSDRCYDLLSIHSSAVPHP